MLSQLLLLGLLAAPFTADDQGAWKFSAPGAPALSGSLFLWHDAWKYEVPAANALTGSATGAKIRYTLQTQPDGDGLKLTYTFRRDPGINLSRGLFMVVQLPVKPLGQRVVRFSGADSVSNSGTWSAGGDWLSVNLDERQAFRLQTHLPTTFERRADSAGRIFINVRLLPADFPEGRDVTASVRLGLEPAGSERLPWQTERRAPLALRGASFAATTVPVNAPALLSVDLTGTWDNPFDPAQIALDATIATPDGRSLAVPGYWYQDYRERTGDGVQMLEKVGEPGWRLRFTPTVPGDYSVRLTARDRSGQTSLGPLKLTATASAWPGMVRLGRSKRVFVRENGGSVFLVGHNVTDYQTGRRSMAQTFDAMVAGGENFTRMWMWSNSLGLEWNQPAGTYRLGEAWRLDNLFRLASERGVLILLCLDTHQDFREKFPQHPYHVDRGGPCAKPLDYFTNERAAALYRQRLRYVAARWGCEPNLVAWEFANEIEGWDGYQKNQEPVARWHSAMAQELRALDAYAHPITTSCWTTEGWPTLWNAPGLDFIQAHHYANSKVDMAARTVAVCRALQTSYPGRLLLFGEMGIHSKFSVGNGDDEDPTGVHLLRQSWAALFAGSASVPANWWHDGYFEKHNLYGRFLGVAKFAQRLDLDRPWQSVDLPAPSWVTPPTKVAVSDLEFAGGNGGWEGAPRVTKFVLGNDGRINDLDALPNRLHGGNHRAQQVPLDFVLDMPAAGRFILSVGTGSKSPHILADLDGQRVYDREFTCGEGQGKESRYQERWKLWETRFDEEIALALPAGAHTLTLRNTGGDWLEVKGYRVTGYVRQLAPPLVVQAMRDGDTLAGWVRHTRGWWLPVARGEQFGPVPSTRLSLPAGRWRVELFDTATGAPTQTLDGAGELILPVVTADLAFIARRTGN